MSKLVLAISLFIGIYCSEAQNCKVFMKGIDATYTGDCIKGKADGKGFAKGIDTYNGNFKKGFPEGQGAYKWQNGDVYEGEWKKGFMDGSGKLTKSDGSVKTGYWKKSEYLGIYMEPFKKLDKSSNVSSYGLIQDKEQTNLVKFYLIEDQKNMSRPNINVIVHKGSYSNIIINDLYTELQNVTFPFKAKIYFGQDFIEFEIFNAGSWDVRANLTNIKGLNNN